MTQIENVQKDAISALIIGDGRLVLSCIDSILSLGGQIVGVVSLNPGILNEVSERGISTFSSSASEPGSAESFDAFYSQFGDFTNSLDYDLLVSVENSLMLPGDIITRASTGSIHFQVKSNEASPASIGNTIGESKDSGYPEVSAGWFQIPSPGEPPVILWGKKFHSDELGGSDIAPDRLTEKWCVDGLSALWENLKSGAASKISDVIPSSGIHPASALVDWEMPASAIASRVRLLSFSEFPDLFGFPRFIHMNRVYLLRECRVSAVVPTPESAENIPVPGTILDISENTIHVATGSETLEISGVSDSLGRPVDLISTFPRGTALNDPATGHPDPLQRERCEKWIHDTFQIQVSWSRQLLGVSPFVIPGFWLQGVTSATHQSALASNPVSTTDSDRQPIIDQVPSGEKSSYFTSDYHHLPIWAPDCDSHIESSLWISGVLAAFLARITGQFDLSISIGIEDMFPTDHSWGQLFCPTIPLQWHIASDCPLQELWWQNRARAFELVEISPFLLDQFARLSSDDSGPSLDDHLTTYVGSGTYRENLPVRPAVGVEILPDSQFRFFADSSILEPAIAQALSRAFEDFFHSLTENPGLELPFLNMGNPGLVRRLEPSFEFDNPASTTILDLIENQAEFSGENTAIICGDSSINYENLWARSSAYTVCLQEKNIEPGDRVGLFLSRSLDYSAAMLGAWRAGACVVFLSRDLPGDRLGKMSTLADLKLLIAEDSDLDYPQEWYSSSDFNVICPAQIPTDAPRALNSKVRLVPFDYSSPAYIIFTSGSTGDPKPVLIGHRELTHHCLAFQQALNLTHSCRVLQFAGLGFDVCLEEIVPTLAAGATLVLRDDEWISSASGFWERVSTSGISHLNLPTAFWYSLVDESSKGDVPVCVHHLIVGGERVDESYLSRWFSLEPLRTRLWNGYGPTETTITATLLPIDFAPPQSHQGNTVPIGFGLGCCDIFLLDALGKPLPSGIPGEILIAGNGVGRGYFNAPEVTDRQFIESPMMGKGVDHSRAYLSGDFGRLLNDGSLHFLGRVDSQVKVRGYRLELHEIEHQIESLSQVDQAIVIDIPGADGKSSALAAFLKLSKSSGSNNNPQVRDIQLELARQLPEFMIPSWISLVDIWPRTSNGKIDFKALRSHAVALASSPPAETAAETPAQPLYLDSPDLIAIARIWGDIFSDSSRPHSLDEDFFANGGDSLGAMRLLSRISKELKVSVSLTGFHKNPTVAGLANLVRSGQVVDSEITRLNPEVPSDPDESDESGSPEASGDTGHIQSDHFIPLHGRGTGYPVFILPGGAGGDIETFIYSHLTRSLAEDNDNDIDIQFLAFQPLLQNQDSFPFKSVDEMADVCVEGIIRHCPDRPVMLIGDCIGSILAFQVVNQLESLGHQVRLTALLDSQPDFHREAANQDSLPPVSPHVLRIRRILGYLGRFISSIPTQWPAILADIRETRNRHRAMAAAHQDPPIQSEIPESLGTFYFDMLLEFSPPGIQAPIADFLPTHKKKLPLSKTWKNQTQGNYSQFFYKEADELDYLGQPLNYVRDKKLDLAPSLLRLLKDSLHSDKS